jgi:type II secretory pathway component PulK
MINGVGARRGFALLAVLWVIVGLAGLALGVSLAARNAIASAHNRTDITRATWRASECIERARAAIAELLTAPPERDGRGLSGWSALDVAVPASPMVTSAKCEVRLHVTGDRIDINHADAEMLGIALGELGVQVPTCDSMVDALLDWRDADSVPRPLGAERAWYVAHGRFAPRDDAFDDVRELARVRGFDKLRGLDSIFGIETGRVALAHAPLSVIAALPGLAGEATARIAEERARGASPEDLTTIAAQLSPDARRLMLSRYADLVHSATIEPDAWILQGRGTVGSPAVTVVVEVKLVRAGDRAAIVRTRAWAA